MGSERRLRLFIDARIVVLLLFLVSTIVVRYADPAMNYERFQPGVIRLMAFSFLFSVCSLLALRLQKFTLFLAYLQVIWDLLFVTVLLLFTGGILSPYSFLYLISIMIAGMLLGRREALYTASLCGILYGAILDFHYFGSLAFIGLLPEDAQHIGSSRLFYTIFLNLVAFGLTAFITGQLSERARQSEEALHQSSIDYDELTRLNSTIVAHSDSGILTTTADGRIRVFNPYAESLVGLGLSDVYDRPIGNFFPRIASAMLTEKEPASGECDYRMHDNTSVILGYSASRFSSSSGVLAGYIVTIRDLTPLRRMEIALKRADRLAALGELSARMAHEIRNPLAALCGSVQLLASHGVVEESDRRLLTIVTREANRLDALITEFLEYAHPKQPQRENLRLFELLEDTCILLSGDSRFDSVEIRNRVPLHSIIAVDHNQFRQVLLNLLKNAADAQPEGGTISIESRIELSGADGFQKKPVTLITISDNGLGMSDEALLHIFEPFWTSKPHGTGLGLAICYRIIQGHGGQISCENREGEGCRFTITLPSTPE
ncbi:MAG TPA: PAS domain-containing protein [Desulfuromonadales bacterium]|nr:PAS domain-containing protein [Desulfuromonadales bacterium]